LKIAITLALIGSIVGEFVGADEGLGYLLMIANNNLDTLLCFAALVVLMFVGAVMFWIAAKLETWICPWHITVRKNESRSARL
jgi:NitT/TauT family transport system permease protein